MTPNEYLQAILKEQTFDKDSPELERLREHREDVESLLQENLQSTPHIRYGGSHAKGTMNREAYDLDIICFFDHEDDEDSATIAELYETVYKILAKEYWLEKKNCSIRLKSREAETLGQDFHIDVVPGRYIDDSRDDCFLHQDQGDKKRLKTNLQTHISHIKDSGVIPAIRILKLWKARRSLQVKQFVLELLAVKLLSPEKDRSLADQLEFFWQEIDDSEEPIKVKDPANPEGNDLTDLLSSSIWQELRSVAKTTLWQIENSGWGLVFGELEEEEDDDSSANARRAAVASVSNPSPPWSDLEE